MQLVIIFVSGKLSKISTETEKEYNSLGYGRKILIEAGVYFEQEIQTVFIIIVLRVFLGLKNVIEARVRFWLYKNCSSQKNG